MRRLSLPLLYVFLAPAAALGEPLDFYQQIALVGDVDADGLASCGDVVVVQTFFGSTTTNFTDLTAVLPVPPELELIPGETFLVGSESNDCSLASGNTAGDTAAVADCPFVCNSPAACTQNGAAMWYRAQITTTSATSTSVQATLDSNETGPQVGDDLGGGTPERLPSVLAIVPCPVGEPQPPPPPPEAAELTVTKRDVLVVDVDGDGLADPGDTLRYEVAVRSHGGQAALEVRFVSEIPDHASLVVGSVVAPPGGSVVLGNSPGDPRVIVDLEAITVSTTRALSFEVQIDPVVPAGVDEIVCQGFADSFNVHPDTLSDDPDTPPILDPTVTPLDFDPDLAIAKTADRASAGAGELIVFSLSAINGGLAPAAGVVVTETVPPHTRFAAAASSAGWSCADGAVAGSTCTAALGALAPGEARELDFAVSVVDALPAAATSTTNRASVADDGSQGPDPTPADNAAEATVGLTGDPEVVVTKTGPPSITPGDVLTYTIGYANVGTREAVGVEIVETVPAHTTFDAGASTPGWSCANGAPGGSSCVLARASLPADGSERTVAFAVRVDATVPAGVEAIANRVVVTHTDPPDVPPEDEVETPLDASPDLQVGKSGPAVARPGDVVLYSVTAENVGDQDAAGVTLSEVVPALTTFVAAPSTAGWSCADGAAAGTACSFDLGTLVAGAPLRQVTFAVRLADAIPAGVELIVNRVTLLEAGEPGPVDEAETVIDAAPDLVLDKQDDDVVVSPGGLVLYTLFVSNAGNQDATGVVVTDEVPEWTHVEPGSSTPGWSCIVGAPPFVCSFPLGDVAAGETAPPLVLALRLDEAAPFDLEEIVNAAAVAADEDSEPGNDTDTETTPVERVEGPPPATALVVATLADAPVEDLDGDGALDPGEELSYVAVVENRGPAVAENVILTLPVDVASELVGSPTTTHGGLQVLGVEETVLFVALGDLAVGETATVTFEVALVVPVPPLLAELVVQGVATLDSGPAAVTDDPDTPAPLDPTHTPVDAAGGGSIVEVPTASGFGLALLAAALAVVAYRRLRRRPGTEVAS